jgi:hypothetical protein
LFDLVGPEIVPFNFGEVYEGESSQVLCVLSKGDDPVRLEWFHNSEQLGTTTDRQDVNVIATGPRASVLVLQSLTAEHFGNYTCRATNAAGTASHTSQLIINGY